MGLGYRLTPHLEYYCAATGVWPTWIRALNVACVIPGAYTQLPGWDPLEEWGEEG